MTKYREILRLRHLGFSERNIARAAGVSRNMVKRVVGDSAGSSAVGDSSTTFASSVPQGLQPGLRLDNGSLVVQNVSRETSLNLFNALGHRVMNVNLTVTGESRVSLVHLPKGTYFAVLKSAENVQKMTVQVK